MLLTMFLITAGPLYTNEEYNCTKVAPFSNFSRADTGFETPPTPIKGILPLRIEFT